MVSFVGVVVGRGLVVAESLVAGDGDFEVLVCLLLVMVVCRGPDGGEGGALSTRCPEAGQ
jgi:hypothetical protein